MRPEDYFLMLDSYLEERKSPTKLMPRPKMKQFEPIELQYRRTIMQNQKKLAKKNQDLPLVPVRELEEIMQTEMSSSRSTTGQWARKMNLENANSKAESMAGEKQPSARESATFTQVASANNATFRGTAATFHAIEEYQTAEAAEAVTEPLSATADAATGAERARVSFAVDANLGVELANAKSQTSDENINLPEAPPKSHTNSVVHEHANSREE